jgi:hypothetical protein
VSAVGCHAENTTGLKLSVSGAADDLVGLSGVFGIDHPGVSIVVDVPGVLKAPSSAILDAAVDPVLLWQDDLLLKASRDTNATRPDVKSTALINAEFADNS